MTPERFGQRLFELGLIDNKQLETVWGEIGTRTVTLEEFIAAFVRRGLVTNFQADRILKGERTGYFYGKYKVLYLIGTGTFARVYRAVHIDTGRVVAVKVLRKRYREDLVEYEQFLREGRMGSKLRHVNVVPIYEVNGDPKAPYMVMEFVEGQTLRDMVRIRGKLDPITTLKIIADVLSGLQYAVEQNITHRDLKMSNVLVSSAGRAKLVDFGLAAAHMDEEKLADCPNARAIDYAALERGTGVRKDDLRSDIYFAGCLMYNMLTGKPPLYETKDRIQRLNMGRFREITPVTQLEPSTPLPVTLIVNKSMELDPTKRYQTALEMFREVQQIIQRLQTLGTAATAAPVSHPSQTNGEEQEVVQESPEPVDDIATGPLEGDNHSVMIVESKIEMQNLLRDRLKKRGYRVLITNDPERAIGRLVDSPDLVDCIIFCTTELGDQAVDGFNRLGEDSATKNVPAILFLHQRSKEWQEKALQNSRRVALVSPKLGELRVALQRLINVPPSSSKAG
jgi:serine/threonine-protein kinase